MSTSKHPAIRGIKTAPLLYWLLVVCGLFGLTVVRIDDSDSLIPIWVGSLAGVGLGQLLAFLRVRAWVPIAVVTGGCWLLAPLVSIILYEVLGRQWEPAMAAFLPAAVCGYLSLSEKSGLVAFWFPAVLWMLVILDGPAPGQMNTTASLPFLVGLGGLFVAFLHAREARRVALWRAYGGPRLAEAKPRAVLRSSPLRAVSQHLWTAFAGTVALVVATWIAPQLWQKEEASHKRAFAANSGHFYGAGPYGASPSSASEPQCCDAEAKSVKVSEYFPLMRSHDEHLEQAQANMCVQCGGDGRTAHAFGSKRGDWTGSFGVGYASGTTTRTDWESSPATYPSYPYSYPYSAAQSAGQGTDPAVAPSFKVDPTPAVVAPAKNGKKHSVVAVPPPPPVAIAPPTLPTLTPVPAAVAAKPASAGAGPATLVVPRPMAAVGPGSVVVRGEAIPPWESMLVLCLSAIAGHLFMRGIRRQLTLRHLTRPFWNESLDQRISNHWQRMLIGLRDAGIRPRPAEQPQAFARRAGIPGMTTCATILERVRHGVRVDAEDLQSMLASSSVVYAEARKRAGLAARAAGWFRSPLA